jgi:flagellar biosynthesis/type III secretory pathway protein FliH
MEKVWEELKKIDAQAEQIRSEAQINTKELARLVQKETQELLTNGKTYAQQEAQELYEKKASEANQNRQKQLKENQQTIKKLNEKAQQRMEKAALTVVSSVLEET